MFYGGVLAAIDPYRVLRVRHGKWEGLNSTAWRYKHTQEAKTGSIITKTARNYSLLLHVIHNCTGRQGLLLLQLNQCVWEINFKFSGVN